MTDKAETGALVGDNQGARFIHLEGATNFRDVGGYPASGKGQIKPGRLFRSDALSELTETDTAIIGHLGLRSVYDLRSAKERQRAPNRQPAGARIWEASADEYHPETAAISKNIYAAVCNGSFDVQEVDAWLCRRYELFARDELFEFQRLAQDLLNQDVFPALIHCASGKDRTGFFIAMILSALEVPDGVIMADYLLSNRRPRSVAHHFPPGSPSNPLTYLAGVRASMLQASFAAIDRDWGSRDRFLTEALGWRVDERRCLWAQLVEVVERV